jgi:iron complex transport system ATP-binding protein
MEKILEGRDIRFSYDGVEVIKGVNLSIGQGTIVGLLGANGVGKSTLLKVLTGILSTKHGEILYKGRELKYLPKREISKRIAYVPQSPAFGFPFTVSEIVKMGRAPYLGRFEFENDKDNEIAFQAMETVGITHLQDRLVREISGGEKQLASFARALAQEPELMVLDEPATFLDVKHKTEILRLLLKLKKERNISIIAATHDVFSGLFYFDRLIILKDGEILAEGTCDQVLTDDTLSKAYNIGVTVRREDGKIFVFPAETNRELAPTLR